MLAIPKAPALALPVAPAAAPDDAAAALALRRPLEAPPEIPVFIRTLYRLLNQVDPEIIRWADDGTHIVITNSTRFAAEACPKFFRHRNFQSFTRLLNMYQFSKVSARDAKIGCYAHEFFKRGKEELLYKIHRKPREEKKKKRGLVEAGKADPAAEKDAKEAKAGPSSAVATAEVKAEAAGDPPDDSEAMAADVAAMMQRCTELETEAKRLRAENEWLRRAELEREQLNLELVRHQATIEKLTQAAFLKTQQTLEQNARMWTTMSAMGAPDAWRPGAAPAAAAARAALGGDVNANDSKLKKLTSHLTHGDVADAVSTAQRGEAAQGRAFVLPDFLGDMTDYGLAELGPDDAAARASPSPSPALAAHAAPTVLPPALAVDEFPVDASCDLYGALVSGALDAKDKDLDMAHMSSFSASTCNILQSMLASNGHDLLQSTKEVDQGHDPFESAAAACALDDDDRRKNGDGRSWPLRKSAAPKKAAARSDTRGPRLRGRRRGDTDRPAAALVTPPPASPAAPRAAGARAALCDPSLPPAVAQAPFGGTPAAFMRQMFTQQQVTMMMAQQPPAPGAAQTTRPFSLPFCDRPPPPLPTTLQPSPRRSEPKSEPNAAELNQEMFKMLCEMSSERKPPAAAAPAPLAAAAPADPLAMMRLMQQAWYQCQASATSPAH